MVVNNPIKDNDISS